MKIQALFLLQMFMMIVSVRLTAQTEWKTDNWIASDSVSYFETVDTIQYEPVIGVDGKTYINAQEASFAGITSWKIQEEVSYDKVAIEQPEITWIEFLEINGMQADNMEQEDGYQDQTHYIFDLFAARENHLFFNAEHFQHTCEMRWRIWIDFNENHQFEEAEMVFVGEGTQQEIHLLLPSMQQREFITRMRIAWTPQESAQDTGSLVIGSVKDVSVYIQ